SSRAALAATRAPANGGASFSSILVAAPAATATRTVPTPPAATATAARALARFADVDLTAADVAAIDVGDRLLGLGVRAHLDEAEPARAAGRAIRHHGRGLARSGLREQPLQIIVG